MTITELLDGLATMTSAQRLGRYSDERASEEGDWLAINAAAAMLAEGGDDKAELMRLVQRHGADAIVDLYWAWRSRAIEARKPPVHRRRR